MRTNEFTFKKTKRVKQVVEHRAISVDLTEQEAVDLSVVVGNIFLSDLEPKAHEFFNTLYDKLIEFTRKNPTTLRRVFSRSAQVLGTSTK